MKGFVFSKFWSWFIVGTFNNVQQLSISQSIGIVFTFSLLMLPFAKNKEKTSKLENIGSKSLEGLFINFMVCLFALFAGWIVTLFM